MRRCIDCGGVASNMFARCAPCLDRMSAELDGIHAGVATAALLGDLLGREPVPGSYEHRQWQASLRSVRASCTQAEVVDALNRAAALAEERGQ